MHKLLHHRKLFNIVMQERSHWGRDHLAVNTDSNMVQLNTPVELSDLCAHPTLHPSSLSKHCDAGELPGLWKLGQSYLALDTDSRVIRLDSFAKFLAPGFRLGWVTAHPTFVDKLTWHMHGTALGPCSTTQVISFALTCLSVLEQLYWQLSLYLMCNVLWKRGHVLGF